MKHAPIYFTTADRAPKPSNITNHAVDRFMERYRDEFEFEYAASVGVEWRRARNVLEAVIQHADRYVESYEPGDLHGLGQAVWVGYSQHARIPVRFTVDGNGNVRTVLPWP